MKELCVENKFGDGLTINCAGNLIAHGDDEVTDDYTSIDLGKLTPDMCDKLIAMLTEAKERMK